MDFIFTPKIIVVVVLCNPLFFLYILFGKQGVPQPRVGIPPKPHPTGEDDNKCQLGRGGEGRDIKIMLVGGVSKGGEEIGVISSNLR